jgi:sarcosine oxidase subunit gamma
VADPSASFIGSTVPGRYGAGGARLVLGELTLAGAWNVQGKPAGSTLVDEVQAMIGVRLPLAPNTMNRTDAIAALWLGPESWLLVARGASPRPDIAAARVSINAAGGAMFDVSAGRVAYAVTGANAEALLAARCPLDFHADAFPVGSCAQSLFGHVGALYYRRGAEDFVVMVARSYARDAWHSLCVSAAAGGYDVAPTATFD